MTASAKASDFKKIAAHPILVKALALAAPKGHAAPTVSLDMKSGGLTPLEQINDTTYLAKGPVARWTRRNWREAQIRQDNTGSSSILLGLELVTRQGRKDRYPRHAPRLIQPLSYDPSIDAFLATGPREKNRDLAALIANGATILSVDEAFSSVFIAPRSASAKRRLIDPTENPSVVHAPAFRRLLQIDDHPGAHAPIPDRAPELKAQRRTPLDADQQAAYAAALTGADIVVHGPPGTGKSEVIAEIARAGLEAGRRVLIASIVESALAVSRRRLEATGHIERFGDRLALETPASFLDRPTKEDLFDLLIIDEANRLTVYDALLLASRARQIVLCGDDKQIPVPDGVPNTYAHGVDLGFETKPLRKHYRSKFDPLITFSNAAAYSGELRVIPSPIIAAHTGVRLSYFPKPRWRMTPHGIVNLSEAKAIAGRLAILANAEMENSLCVIAATPGQVIAINEEIQKRAISKKALSPVSHEPFFVRTFNDIQGDERDISLVSMTYVPKNGSMDGALGALEREGRSMERLNVAFSRSRLSCEAFISFAANHLARANQAPAAHCALAQFLETRLVALAGRKNPVDAIYQATENIRRPGDRLDNLGIVHGWARPGSTRYDIGILVRFKVTPQPVWDQAIAQLKVAGWDNLLIFEQIQFKTAFYEVQDAIEAAVR